ncbi:MAG: DNA/RNA nuclease SfsA [Bacillota bacterium]|jgi:sugar fermentation stimulation protein A
MYYPLIKPGIFLNRPNRFIAQVLVEGKTETVHVKNTGRCRELLRPHARVMLEEAHNPKRKTKYSLISVYKNNMLVNMDSQAPNEVVWGAVQNGRIPEIPDVARLKREVTFGQSRFDLYFETAHGQKGFVEIKGVTLEEEGIAKFPDAPTLRGTKHLRELIQAVRAGYQGFVFFLVQMKGIKYFTPHSRMDQDFSQALKEAEAAGVNILVYDSHVTPHEITLGEKIEYFLK